MTIYKLIKTIWNRQNTLAYYGDLKTYYNYLELTKHSSLLWQFKNILKLFGTDKTLKLIMAI
jgi:hypothetical protein